MGIRERGASGRIAWALVVSAWLAILPVQARPIPQELTVDEWTEASIQQGESHVYTLPPGFDGLWRVTLEQRGIELEVAELRNGDEVGTVNHHRYRFEREVFRIDGSVDAVAVRPVVGGEPEGDYALRLERAVHEPAERLRLERRLTEASRVPHGAEGSALSRAAGIYESVAAELRSQVAADAFENPDAERAAALFAAANHRRVLGEADRAAELFTESAQIWRRLGRAPEEAASLVGLGQVERRRGRPEAARTALEDALELWALAGDHDAEIAQTHNSLGLVAHRDGDYLTALGHYRTAYEIQERAGREREVAAIGLNLGSVSARLGDAESALDALQTSLGIFRRLGDRRSELLTLSNWAHLQRRLSRPEVALELSDQAHALAVELEDSRSEGRILSNRAATYLNLGDFEKASTDLLRALALAREADDQRGRLSALSNLGNCAYHLGDFDAARAHWQASLDLEGGQMDQRLRAWLLARVAHLDARHGAADHQGGSERVEEMFRSAQALLEGRGDLLSEARLLSLQGEARLRQGRPREALDALSASLRRWESQDRAEGKVLTWIASARAARALGDVATAARHARSAIEEMESVRSEMVHPDLRADFMAARYEAFEIQMDNLLDLHGRRPGEGYLEAALELGERARGRRLLDLVLEARSRSPESTAPTMEKRARLADRLSLLVRRRELVELGRRKPVEGENLSAQIADLQARLDLLDIEIRRSHPRSELLKDPPRTDLETVRGLLDPGTVLLAYSLGQERSHLFLVSDEDLAHVPLPPRAEVERSARAFHEAVGSAGGATGRPGAASEELARMILEPVADRLEGAGLEGAGLLEKRLAILADGALHYVPFAALPWRSDGARGSERVVDRFEVVRLPSVAVLAAEREVAGPRVADFTQASLTVLADPVFDLRDPRFAPAGSALGPEPEGVVAQLRGVEAAPAVFGRLPGSGVEAEAIAAHVPPSRLKLALGFEAGADVLQGVAGTGSILHFATHGLIDAEHPELSGLVLSQFHADGRRRSDGFLRLYDIYGLHIEADLVVLSGCRTALGRELKGEAFQGLASGFLHAGAHRVMASLWPVSDRATARLMEHFYRALMVDGLRPPAALRRAQLQMAEDRRFRDPYYWAGFVLQGDWR